MALTFVHTADWQIGKPFGGFDERMAGRLEAARLDAIDRVADAARSAGAAFVLVAGDVFDSPDLSTLTLRQPLERLRRHDDLQWLLLPGNHDFAGPAGLWHRLVAVIGLPDNVTALLKSEPHVIAGGRAVVLPAPLTARSVSEDPTSWMADATTAEGVHRIGLAHGAVHGFGGTSQSSVPIDPRRAQVANLDYLALGDWHGVKEVAPRTWYSGTPEPDNFADSDKGSALVVVLGGAARADVRRVPTAHFHWSRIARRMTSAADLSALQRDVERLGPEGHRHVLKLDLSGEVGLEAHEALDRWLDALRGRVAHLAVHASGLLLARGDGDEALGVVERSDELRAVAQRLASLAAGEAYPGERTASGADQRQEAAAALRRLLALSREVEESAA
ncbi:MAG: exonuclease SbcCD subunit D [Hyphomicrobiaceae bacterium]